MNLTGIDKMKRTLDRAHNLQLKIEAMQAKRDALPLGKFGKIVLRPFANSLIPAIEEKYGKKVRHGNQHVEAVELSGPFGLMSEYMVEWHFTDGTSCYLVVTRNESSFNVKPREFSNEFAPNTVGARNGMNQKSIHISKLSEEDILSLTTLHTEK